MSIHNTIDKIKSKTGIDNITIFYMIIIIGVAVGSFGLGRISSIEGVEEGNNKANKEVEGLTMANNGDTITESSNMIPQVEHKQKKYVASKNGKMYYSVGCSGAKRIKVENEVWFSTMEDAEKSGYTLSSTCK